MNDKKREKILGKLRKTLDSIAYLPQSFSLYQQVMAAVGTPIVFTYSISPEATILEQFVAESEGLLVYHEAFEEYWRKFKSDDLQPGDPRNIFVGYKGPLTENYKLRMKVDDFFGYDY
jgi:hypothetical protein